jgi:hypothetical protein
MVDEKFLENKLIEPKAKDKKRKGEKNLERNVDDVDEIKNGAIRTEGREEEEIQFNNFLKEEDDQNEAELEVGKDLEDENLNVEIIERVVSRILDTISLQVYLFYINNFRFFFFFFFNFYI